MREYDEVLIALRRIIRATDLHAKTVARQTGLTPTQLLVLQTLADAGPVPTGHVARAINLSQATVTSILDRLQAKRLVDRQRARTDKRIVAVLLTPEGRATLAAAPPRLQDRFVAAFSELEGWERHWLIAALHRVSHMMQADEIDASPVLDIGDIDRVPEGEAG